MWIFLLSHDSHPSTKLAWLNAYDRPMIRAPRCSKENGTGNATRQRSEQGSDANMGFQVDSPASQGSSTGSMTRSRAQCVRYDVDFSLTA